MLTYLKHNYSLELMEIVKKVNSGPILARLTQIWVPKDMFISFTSASS